MATGLGIGAAPFVLGASADVISLRAAFLVIPAFLVAALGALRATRAARSVPRDR